MLRNLARGLIVIVLAVFALPAIAYAQYTSNNYSIDEIMIGTGGDPELCSDSYCAQQSAGGTAVGEANSDNYGILAGFGSPEEPTLSVIVSNNIIDLGVLSISSTGAATANFSVSNYLSSGYIVRINGSPPTNVSGDAIHALTALNSPNPSQVGTEQFGINLKANTTPGIGAEPVQQPDSSFSYGAPAIGYDQADYFKYEDGDIVAESNQETGQTDYTISIIANIATSTPGGRYRTTLVVQAIATF